MGRKEGCEDGGAPKAAPLARATQQVGVSTPLMHGPPPEVRPPGRRCAGNFCFGRRLGQGGRGKQIWGAGSTRGAPLPEGRRGKGGAAGAPGTFWGGDAAGEGQGASTPDPACAGGVQDLHPVLCGVSGGLGALARLQRGLGSQRFGARVPALG